MGVAGRAGHCHGGPEAVGDLQGTHLSITGPPQWSCPCQTDPPQAGPCPHVPLCCSCHLCPDERPCLWFTHHNSGKPPSTLSQPRPWPKPLTSGPDPLTGLPIPTLPKPTPPPRPTHPSSSPFPSQEPKDLSNKSTGSHPPPCCELSMAPHCSQNKVLTSDSSFRFA